MSPIRCCLTPRLLSWSWISCLFVLWLSPLSANAANLTGLTISPANPTIQVGKSVQLIATGTYDDNTQKIISQAKQVSAGGSPWGHTCALNADGTISCWGDNTFGQLGNGTTTASLTPVAVSGINTAVAVSVAVDLSYSSYACALLADGSARCWGGNRYGQLGNGGSTGYGAGSSTPVTVSGINNAVSISAGDRHACAVLADGTIKCWGEGALGNGTIFSSSVPLTVSGISTAVAVSTGGWDANGNHTCAVLADGTVRCWGSNLAGQLGNGGSTGYGAGSSTPVTVSGINTAVAVSAGTFHTCAVLADGMAWCWGSNFSGQLGNGTTTNSLVPVNVSDISTAVAISAGGNHTCAVLADSTLRCWGYNGYGQLGNGATVDSTIPVTVNGVGTAVTISVGAAYTCARLADGTARCWGYNNAGQLGDGFTGTFKPTPTPVLGYTPLTWTSSNPAVVTVDGVGGVKALSAGTTLITASVNGVSASTLITVSPALVLDGFWPATAKPGQFIFLFGQGFVPNQTKVQINGIPASFFVQVADPTLLFLMLPAGDTRGPITITTPSGSVTSSQSFNVPLTGVQITGLWPSIVSPGQLVFVFGSGFVTNATTATVNSIKAPILQVLEPTLLFFMAPSTPTTGFVSVTTSAGTATSASVLMIK